MINNEGESCSAQGRRFGPGDYVVFVVVLATSAAIGIWYALKDYRKKNVGTEVYLMAKRNMHFIPVALSLTVSFMSAITILGTPSEVYSYGLMIWWLVPAFCISAVVIAEIYIPTFHRLGINSSYEYLEMRFNRSVRLLATACFIVETTMYVGIVMYAPALALSEVTCFNMWVAVLSTGIVCTFYTTVIVSLTTSRHLVNTRCKVFCEVVLTSFQYPGLVCRYNNLKQCCIGGLKAVIWTDVLQSIIMVSGLLAVLLRGSMLKGGIGNILSTAREDGRLALDYTDADPRVRHSVWSMLVGGTMVWMTMYAVAQSQVQRYLCCKSERQSKLALYMNALGLGIVISLACLCGLVLYSFYGHCDPILTGDISKPDRLMPYLVMEILGEFQGIPGLFVACVYSGSLSTISTGVHAMAMVTVEDFIKPCSNFSDQIHTKLSKGFGIVYGIICLGMAYLASTLGGVLQAALSIFGIVGGPLVGIYTMGMIFPFANSLGAISGLFSGLAATVWLYIGANRYRSNSVYFTRKLPVYADQCTNYTLLSFEESSTSSFIVTNTTDTGDIYTEPTGFTTIYSVSYMYYSCIGFAVTLAVGLLISLATGGLKQISIMNPKLIHCLFDHPALRWLPSNFRKVMRCGLPEPAVQLTEEDIPLNGTKDSSLQKTTNNNHETGKENRDDEILISKNNNFV